MNHVCPWWLGWVLASPLRKLWQDPNRILSPWVREGMIVLEPGPGMGFFTLEIARLVGPKGKVVAVDIQERMLDGLRKRARRAGLAERIETRLASEAGLGIDDLAGTIDLVVAMWMVHELPDAGRFFAESRRALAPGGKLLVVEPAGHVGREAFEATLVAGERAGFRRGPGPELRGCLTATLA